jgi:hypothetical protein
LLIENLCGATVLSIKLALGFGNLSRDFGRGSFLLGRICASEQEMLWAFSQIARSNNFRLRHSL